MTIEQLEKAAERLLEAAKNAPNGVEAMQYTQAVLNLSHARYAYLPSEKGGLQNAARSSSAS